MVARVEPAKLLKLIKKDSIFQRSIAVAYCQRFSHLPFVGREALLVVWATSKLHASRLGVGRCG